MLWFGLQTTLTFRLVKPARIGFLFLAICYCGETRGQELKTVYVKQATSCLPNPQLPVSNDQQFPANPRLMNLNFNELASWRADPLDDKTTGDLFGGQFSRKFLVYRLCLVNNGAGRGPGPVVYLIQAFLKIPVTITGKNGQPLTPSQLQDLSSKAEFRNLGFGQLNDMARHRETRLCESVNAYYTPFTADQLLERKTYLELGSFEVSKTRRLRLNGFQRRNVVTYVLKALEKISPGQHIERILAVPEQETIGGQEIRVFPCLSYLQFVIILKNGP